MAILQRSRVRARIFRILLVSALLMVLWLFLKLVDIQKNVFDGTKLYEELALKKKVRPIESWQIRFMGCEGHGEEIETCAEIDRMPHAITFPAPDAITSFVQKNKTRPTRAVATHVLTEEELSWIKTQELVSFVMPRSLQKKVSATIGGIHYEAYGPGTNISFTVRTESLLEEKRIRLTFDMTGYEWFGPADLPAVFSEVESADEYLSIIFRQKLAGGVTSRMEVAFPLLLAAMAIILDHSIVFGILSLYGVSRAARTFLTYLLNESQQGKLDRLLLFGTNGLIFALLIVYAVKISNLGRPSNGKLALFVIASVFLFCGWGALQPDFSLTSDLWSDALSAFLGVPVLLAGCYVASKEPRKVGKFELTPSFVLFFVRALLLIVAFLIYGYANSQELFRLNAQELRSPLDWRQLLFFPVLFVSSLMEVGSVARKMNNFASSMAENALLEKEISLARDMQRLMLPAKKSVLEHYAWRSFYHPASALGGDWFDVRVIETKGGNRLLAAIVVDVTGHGLGPALVISAICSQWSLWCENLVQSVIPQDDTEREKNVTAAAKNIDLALLTLKKKNSCTAILVLLDLEVHRMSLCSAGHPGAILAPLLSTPDEKLKFIRTMGSALGMGSLEEEASRTWEASSVSFPEGSCLHLYSDGVLPAEVALAQWIKRLERSALQQKKTITRMIVEGIRNNKLTQSKEKRDDMTLLCIMRNSEGPL